MGGFFPHGIPQDSVLVMAHVDRLLVLFGILLCIANTLVGLLDVFVLRIVRRRSFMIPLLIVSCGTLASTVISYKERETNLRGEVVQMCFFFAAFSCLTLLGTTLLLGSYSTSGQNGSQYLLSKVIKLFNSVLCAVSGYFWIRIFLESSHR